MMNAADTPLLTVVTATFNLVKGGRVDAFRQCAESVHAQSCAASIEHLVIDGASADGSRELIAEYEAKGWLRCISEPDEGIYDAMNKGIAAAKGKYIAFLNSDDYWHDPQGIERSLAVLECAAGDFSYAPVTLLFEDGRRSAEEPQIGGALSGMPFCHQTMLTRTELLRQHGGFRKDVFRGAADYDLILRLLLHGAKAVYVPFNFTTFRSGGFSTGDDVWKREIPQAQHAALDPIFGAEKVADICSGLLDEAATKALGGLLHPTVYNELLRLLAPQPEAPRALRRLKNYSADISDKHVRGLFGLPLWRGRRSGNTLRTIWCGCTLLITRHRPGCTDCRLFGLLPLWSLHYDNYGAATFRLFGVTLGSRKWKRRR